MIENWYIIQIFRGYEERINQHLNAYEEFKVFYPKKRFVKKTKEGQELHLVPLFPGYLFVKTSSSRNHFYDFYQKVIAPLEGVVKILKHKESDALWPEEIAWIKALINEEDVVEASYGLKEADKVIIVSGPLMGRESQINKIDRHKRIAYLNFTLFGETQTLELPLEVLSKKMSD